jgi:hypothetical protein
VAQSEERGPAKSPAAQPLDDGETMSESERQKPGGAAAQGVGSPGSTAGAPRHQRHIRNYLLDKEFQLKYTGIVIGVTALLSAVLGYYLYREIVVSQNTILARDLANDNFVIEPGDIEARQEVSQQLDREFNEALVSKLSVVVSVNNAPPEGAAALYQDHFQEEIGKKSSVLAVALLVFLFVLTVIWVYLTHRIAGPVYKLKLLFSKVDGQSMVVKGRLRKGDELQDAFKAFRDMVDRLRNDRLAKAEQIDEAIKALASAGSVDAEIERLKAVRDDMIASTKDED